MIVRKTVAMEELSQELEQITSDIQEAKKKPAAPKATKGKGVKKGASKRKTVDSAGSSTRSNKETNPGEEPSAPAQPSWLDLNNLGQTVVTAAEYAFERRGYVLFPAAVLLFHLYGDYASV
jgi:hypothetical protein